MKPPRYLYHASPECAFSSIMQTGLKSAFEGIYASEDPQHSLRFMGFRLIDHYHGSKEMEFEGNVIQVPDIVHHDVIHVWKIDTKKTPEKWEEGTDHSPIVFGDATSWLHPGNIPLSAIVSYDSFGMRE